MAAQDEARLHKLCQQGKIKKVKAFVETLSASDLAAKLCYRRGVFGFTPLHEAVSFNRHQVLEYLLVTSKAAHVNCRANSGYTPLHLAASNGNLECIEVLLRNQADIFAKDEFGKTPKQTASLTTRKDVLRTLHSEELVAEVETNGENVTMLLKAPSSHLDPVCLRRALVVAVQNDHPLNVGKLVIKGADNQAECLQMAEECQKHAARAMLLLVRAAKEGNKELTLCLFGEAGDIGNAHIKDLHHLQKAITDGRVSTAVPIEISRRNHRDSVRTELLLRTDVNTEKRIVSWHGLLLQTLSLGWLQKIFWVKTLLLARNDFKVLPSEMGVYLKHVVTLDLQCNKLGEIPPCILKLPCLSDLNISHNRLIKIPNVQEWSPLLSAVDLSHNSLDSMPAHVDAPSIKYLNISNNKFHTVPEAICSFKTLWNLDVSYNQNILTLPEQLGKLKKLTHLKLEGLKFLTDPPKNIQSDTRACVCYLRSKYCNARGFYRMKLMLVGCANRGKTTLVARLNNTDCGNESTVGASISEWSYKAGIGKKPFNFSIWDFGGQEEYYSTHQCFLSQHSLYLLVFNLTHGEAGVQELKPWLSNISLRAPKSCVIIVGTHLDEIDDENRGEMHVLLHKVQELASSYKNLSVAEIIPVGLKNRIEKVGYLKEAIYNHAENYQSMTGHYFMGQQIPASYHEVYRQLEIIQQNVKEGLHDPILHETQFKGMLESMNIPGIQDIDELKAVTLFLTDVGALLHYDDQRHNLHQLYFVDPSWLCQMMAKIVTVKERNPFVNNGILHCKHIHLLFRDQKFPWQYFRHYITLLDRFEIALPLDNTQVLIPSLLDDEKPAIIDTNSHESESNPPYKRLLLFGSASTPPGFWSRLLSRIIHSIPQVRAALSKPAPPTETPVEGQQEKPSETHRPVQATEPSITSHLEIDSPAFNLDLSSVVLSNPSTLRQIPERSCHDHKDIQLHYWRTGLAYSDPDVTFTIEAIASEYQGDQTGIFIASSLNNTGRKIIGQLVDLAISVEKDWFPGSSGLEQVILCYECLKLRRKEPFEFEIKHCFLAIAQGKQEIICEYFDDDTSENHIVSLENIVPDLLLLDLDPEFHLSFQEVQFNEDEDSFLGKGAYGKVFKGSYRSKTIAVKIQLEAEKGLQQKDLKTLQKVLYALRNEAILLQKSHHPCLVGLIGVYLRPKIAIVLEMAPLGSLDRPLLKELKNIHRLTIFRMATEVAAALQFLHSIGIVFRDLKAGNVLVWSLNPNSLCHCKLTDFGIATLLAPCGVYSTKLEGTKGFIAPESFGKGERKLYFVYDHKTDIFSFSMLLYQMIVRRNPVRKSKSHNEVVVSVETGERPTLQNVTIAHSGYYYLTKLMKQCWEEDPLNRPLSGEIIKRLSSTEMQSIMCVHPLQKHLKVKIACPIVFPAHTSDSDSLSRLWLCSEHSEHVKVIVYETNTMAEIDKVVIKHANKVTCLCVCGDFVWIAIHDGSDYGTISIFNIYSRAHVHTIRMRQCDISCMCCSDICVYMGTVDGGCLSFRLFDAKVRSTGKPRYKALSRHAVSGIAYVKEYVWVSHFRLIDILDPKTLSSCRSITHAHHSIGKLSLQKDTSTLWSAHIGGCCLSAWDATQQTHRFDVNVTEQLKRAADISQESSTLASISTALDTVWVGLQSGHIVIFHDDKLLAWFHIYTDSVRFLSCIPCIGPSKTESCMIVSGASGYKSPFLRECSGEHPTMPDSGVCTLVLWEVFDSITLKQIKLIEQIAPEHLCNHHAVRSLIQNGNFLDSTKLMLDSWKPNMPSNSIATVKTDKFEEPYDADDLRLQEMESPIEYSIRSDYITPLSEIKTPHRAHLQRETMEHVTIDIDVPSMQHNIRVRCPKPVKLGVLHKELAMNSGLNENSYHLAYFGENNEMVKITGQGHLDKYLKQYSKPQLYLITT